MCVSTYAAPSEDGIQADQPGCGGQAGVGGPRRTSPGWRGWQGLGAGQEEPPGLLHGAGAGGGLPVVFLGEVHLLSRELPGEGLAPAKWPFLASSFESGHP